MAELNRLFFALAPDDAVRKACADAARSINLRAQPGGYLFSPDKYHLTLLFLGDFVSADKQAAAERAAAQLRSAPFALTLDYAGSFRNNSKIPCWLGARELPDALPALHRNLRETMKAAGVAPERMSFTPHLTIIRDAQRSLPDTRIEPIAWDVRDFVLIRSRLDRRPADYEVLGRWPLIEGPAPAAQIPLF